MYASQVSRQKTCNYQTHSCMHTDHSFDARDLACLHVKIPIAFRKQHTNTVFILYINIQEINRGQL